LKVVIMADWYVTVLAGAAGGMIMGVTGYIMAHKTGEQFDAWKFAQTCALPVVAGVAGGVMTTDPFAAFSTGILLKHLQEVAGDMNQLPQPKVTQP